MGMIRIDLDMDMPEECHECPFQLKFKDDEVDPWYMRRCVIMRRNIEYPRPEWCPLEEQPAIVRCADCRKKDKEECPMYVDYPCTNKPGDDWFCADGERKSDG